MSKDVLCQPQRSTKRIREERRFDRTQLREDIHGTFVHRDYGAHFFRWGFISRQMKQGERILDVGCGQDLPLLKVLHGNVGLVPERYVGVDLNRLTRIPNWKWATILDGFDFINDYEKIEGDFTQAVCLEVIEHMDTADGAKLLSAVYSLLRPGGLFYLSTPVFDGLRAANHIHEYTVPELRDAIVAAGFKIKARWGTFASLRDLRKCMTPEETIVHDRLQAYYGQDVLSCMFAPYHPDESRNNLWVLEK